MTNTENPIGASSQVDDREPGLAWEVPEILATAVLAVVGFLVVGGLATGIARSFTYQGPSFGFSSVWNAVQFGAQWASPFVAISVLAVTGVCWWQLQAWAEVIEEPDGNGDDWSEARGHMRRARLMLMCSVVALLVTALGSVAAFAGAVGQGQAGTEWPLVLDDGAVTLAVLVVVGVGVVVGRHLDRRYGLS